MDKWLTSNLVVKVLAILLALMLWMVVNQDRIFEKKTSIEVSDTISKEINRVPVNGQLISQDYVVVQMAQTIDLVLRGKRDVLSKITPTSYELYVDLKGYGEGKHQVPVQTKGFPAGVEVELRPAMIEVTLEEKQVKEMPVTLEIVGKPREGYSIGNSIISPATVNVKAAGSQLKLAAVAKGFINIGDATEDIHRPITLKVLDANGNQIPVEIEPPEIEVTVSIIAPSITVPLQLKLTGEPPTGYAVAKVETNVKEVTVFGAKEILDQVTQYPLPEINLSQLRNTQTFPIKLVKKDQPVAGIVDVDTDEVIVTITVVPSEALMLPDIPIQVKGLSNDHTITFTTPVSGKMNVTLEGAHELLQGVTENQVQASINVTGLTRGEYDLPIDWVIPTYTKLTKDLPKTVRITIQDKASEASTIPGDSNVDAPTDNPDETNSN